MKKASQHPTIAQQADIWLADGKSRKRKPFRPKTAKNYECAVEKHIKPLIGRVSLEVANNRTLKDIVALLTEKKLAAGTITLIVNVVKQIVASAVDENGNQIYPRTWNSEFIDMPVIADQKRPIATADSVQEAIRATLGPDPYSAGLIAILASTGLRIGEALAIKVGPDDGIGTFWVPAESKIIVRQQRRDTDFAPVKTAAGQREVDIAPELNEFLKTLPGQPWTEASLLFPKSEAYYRLALKGCGIEGGFHSLRRFRVTHLDKQNVPSGLVRFWVGHASANVSERYVKSGSEIQARKDWAEKAGIGFGLT